MRDSITAGQLTSFGDSHAPAIDPAPTRPYQQRSLLAKQPHAKLTALHGKPGLEGQVPRLVAKQITQQAQRDPLALGA